MNGTEIQRAYEAEGGLPGKLAVGQVWRDVVVSCQCGTKDSYPVWDEPGEDICFYAAVKRFRLLYKQCKDCGQNYRVGLGKVQ